MKKPKKKEPAICCVAGHTNENCMENVQSIAHCEGYNQAIDDYEKYLKDYESINAEKAREQYQQNMRVNNTKKFTKKKINWGDTRDEPNVELPMFLDLDKMKSKRCPRCRSQTQRGECLHCGH